MSKLLWCCLLLVLAASACSHKIKSRVQSPLGYMGGQQPMAQSQAPPPAVLVRGEVKTPIIPWTEDLTLARAIVAAEYRGLWDPHAIFIIRNGRPFKINPKHLLWGTEDPLLEPGDIV